MRVGIGALLVTLALTSCMTPDRSGLPGTAKVFYTHLAEGNSEEAKMMVAFPLWVDERFVAEEEWAKFFNRFNAVAVQDRLLLTRDFEFPQDEAESPKARKIYSFLEGREARYIRIVDLWLESEERGIAVIFGVEGDSWKVVGVSANRLRDKLHR